MSIGIASLVTPAIGSRFRGWMELLSTMAPKTIAPKYWPRLLTVSAIALLSRPFQWYEEWRLRRHLEQTVIQPSPVFIIGHWRSGTTFLHNLLSQDEQFGYVTTMQSVFPHAFLTNRLFPWLTRTLMPEKRPMDDMRLWPRSPQEEEMALLNYGPYSFYHAWHFPSRTRDFYQRTVRLEGLSKEQHQDWIDAYRHLLEKATFHADGKRLLLKSPANTARINLLLGLFPDARFIFIHRHPLEVYGSTQKLYHKVLPVFQLEDVHFEQVRKDIIWIYKDLMSAYLVQRNLIPSSRLAELSYKELVNHPMERLRDLYRHLGLGDFERVAPRFEAYLKKKGIRSYRKSEYDLPETEIRQLEKEWAFAFERWA